MVYKNDTIATWKCIYVYLLCSSGKLSIYMHCKTFCLYVISYIK